MPTVKSKLQVLGQQLVFKAEKRHVEAVQTPDVQALSPISSAGGDGKEQAFRQSSQAAVVNLV